MRTLGVLLLVWFSTNLSATTFAERVAIAKKIEYQQATQDYFLKGLFPVIGPAMGGIMNAYATQILEKNPIAFWRAGSNG